MNDVYRTLKDFQDKHLREKGIGLSVYFIDIFPCIKLTLKRGNIWIKYVAINSFMEECKEYMIVELFSAMHELLHEVEKENAACYPENAENGQQAELPPAGGQQACVHKTPKMQHKV